jgi:hypothetical protein
MNNQTKILALLSVGAIASYLIYNKKSNKKNATGCPSGMQLYYGTCIPTKNEYAVCPQGYMKESVGGPCVKIPDSTSIGGCGAGEEYRMGYRLGDMTATMGCYPIGANMDINMGSSTGGILGGGAGTNIGGGGTVQGGGGNYSDTSESHYGGGKIQTNVTCNESQQYDAILGMCVNKEVNPAFVQKVEEPIRQPLTIPQQEDIPQDEIIITCPDNYTLKDGMCYPISTTNTIVQPKTKATNNNILYIIGGALLLTTLVLVTNKKK